MPPHSPVFTLVSEGQPYHPKRALEERLHTDLTLLFLGEFTTLWAGKWVVLMETMNCVT